MEEPEKPGHEAAAVTTKPNNSPRPASLKYGSIGELFDQFSDLFLAGTKSLIVSPCGHKIYCFEHHFFHMAGVVVEGIQELTMPNERAIIRAAREGFAHYELREKGSRARHLPSARATLESPDEVWEDNPKVESATWVYVKKFDGKPYEFSVALVGIWEANSSIIVPFSSFQVERKQTSYAISSC
jgi:hypothetical protein